MNRFLKRMLRTIRPAQPVPEEYRQIFKHLYLDIAWFGLLSGSTIAFINVFATRMGASTQQIGMLSAAPALVNLLFALPAGTWLSKRSIGSAVFWTSVLQRVFYLLLIPLPVMLMPDAQVWVIILTTLIMSIPGTAMVVGFNSMFGELVPIEWRGHVAGIRNALIALIATIITLLSGWILDVVPFPTGYQIVFTIGVIGAAFSSLHLLYLARLVGNTSASPGEAGQPRLAARRRPAEEIRAFYLRGVESLRLDAMKGHFSRIMGLLFGWHLTQYMTIPIITPFIVNELGMSNQMIGLAGGLFNVTMFLGSLQLNRATTTFGNKKLTGGGIVGLSAFPLLTALGPAGYLLSNIIGGFAWAMAGGALYNYLLEHIPAHDRPAHMAWYTLVSNAAILIGSLSGPLIAGEFGYIPALLIFGVGRLIAGAAILLWG
jgi:MFS family permease